jgi:putative DNA primase/helicase
MPALDPHFDTIPDELINLPQWVCWREEERDGKKTKVPVNPRTGGNADCTRPDTWSTFLTAQAYYYGNLGNGAGIKGIGFQVTAGDPFVGIDLDDCRDKESGTIEPWADAIIKQSGSYTEISPSGTGIRIFIKGKLPGPGNRKGKIEIYESGRYLTLTGHHLPGTPETIEDRQSELAALHQELFPPQAKPQAGPRPARSVSLDDQEIITRAGAAANGGKFINLWAGDWSGYPSQSEADLSLCSILAFWTQDPVTLDRLFRSSGLFREKWDSRRYSDGRTYGQAVVEKALAGIRETYQRPRVKVKPEETKAEPETEKKENPLAFPAGIIGGVAGKCAALYSSVLEAPAHFFFLAFLTCLGSILSGRLTLLSAIRPQPRIYALFLGESADDRKSTVLSQMVSLFKEAIIDFVVIWGVNSAEGLQKLFEKSKNILLVFDEFRLFVAKSKNEHSVLLPAATSLFESNHFETHTKTSSVTIDEAHLAIMAASTVETFERIWDPAFTDIGFLNRLFIIPGSGLRKFSIPPPIPESEKWRIKNDLKEILALVGDKKELELTTEAKARFDEWYLNQEASIYGKRLDGYALRLMPLLAVNSSKLQVDLKIVEQVLSLVEWQRRVREALSPIDADSVTAKMEEKIRRVLKLGDKSERELKRVTHAHRSGLWVYESAKRNLQKAGEIGWNKGERVYTLN